LEDQDKMNREPGVLIRLSATMAFLLEKASMALEIKASGVRDSRYNAVIKDIDVIENDDIL